MNEQEDYGVVIWNDTSTTLITGDIPCFSLAMEQLGQTMGVYMSTCPPSPMHHGFAVVKRQQDGFTIKALRFTSDWDTLSLPTEPFLDPEQAAEEEKEKEAPIWGRGAEWFWWKWNGSYMEHTYYGPNYFLSFYISDSGGLHFRKGDAGEPTYWRFDTPEMALKAVELAKAVLAEVYA